MTLPYKIPDKKGKFMSAWWVTTTYDGYFTLLFSVNPVEKIKIPNNYPRFSTPEKVIEYWQKLNL